MPPGSTAALQALAFDTGAALGVSSSNGLGAQAREFGATLTFRTSPAGAFAR